MLSPSANPLLLSISTVPYQKTITNLQQIIPISLKYLIQYRQSTCKTIKVLQNVFSCWRYWLKHILKSKLYPTHQYKRSFLQNINEHTPVL